MCFIRIEMLSLKENVILIFVIDSERTEENEIKSNKKRNIK